jgi:hypothetical protein
MAVGQKNPYLYVFPMSDLVPAWLPQTPIWMSCKITHPSSGLMHFIRVSLMLRQKSSSFTRVYYPAQWRKCSCLILSSAKPPVLRYIMNGVRQSEWIFMTSSDLVMPSFGCGVSWDDLVILLALAKAFEMLGSWSSCKKTHVGTIAQLEPSLANSSVILFFSLQDVQVLESVEIVF